MPASGPAAAGVDTAMHRLVGRLLHLAAAIAAVELVPLPYGTDTLPTRDALLVAVTVFGIGKILYDTLFFDHFHS